MRLIFLLFIIFPFSVLAQKSDNVWVFANNTLDFSYFPSKLFSNDFAISPKDLDCICDNNGKLLYIFAGNNLYNSKFEVILKTVGAVTQCTSLIPFPGNNDKTLLFYSDYNTTKSLRCDVIDNKTDDISLFYDFKSHSALLFFAQKENSNDILMLRKSIQNDNDILYVSLISESGITDIYESTIPFQLCRPVVSNNGKYIMSNYNYSNYILVYDDDNAIFNINQLDLGYGIVAFSASSKFLYSLELENSSNNTYNIVRYRLDIPFDEIISTKKVIVTDVLDINISYECFKLGPDGNIYILSKNTLSLIKDADSNNPIFEKDAILLNGDYKNRNLPITFHYEPSTTSNTQTSESQTVCCNKEIEYYIESSNPNSHYVWTFSNPESAEILSHSDNYDNVIVKWKLLGDNEVSTYEVNTQGCSSNASSIKVTVIDSPKAEFDNATVCYGESLNALLSGNAPFSIEYTLDGETKLIENIESTICPMPNISGKYVLKTVSDKNCTSKVESNNTAILGDEMKTLKIIKR